MKEPLLYKIVRPIIRFIMKFIFKAKYKGLENIPSTGRVVLAGNHTNNLDCLLIISSTNRVVHFLAKDSLMKGLKKIIFKNMGIIPVNRKIHDSNALVNAKNTLNDNKVIGIFPEGTINRTKDIIMPFKIGSVKMAYDTNSYIIPFIITGKYRLFSKDLEIEFLSPYKPVSHTTDLTKANEKLMMIIENKLKEKRN